ncbi:MAG: PEP-CTERM sorting domain-containing protein [Aquabacterium sp.]
MNFKLIAAAAALAVSGAANAAIDNMLSANSSALFYGYNTTTGTSVVVDLGVNLNDFLPAYTMLGEPGNVPQGALSKQGVTAVWNFNANTYTLNGTQVAGAPANNWAAAFSSFVNSVSAGGNTFKWGVLAGDNTSDVDLVGKHLVSGTPTDAQLEGQTDSSSANLGQANDLFINLNVFNLINGADNAAYYAAASSDPGYVAKNTNLNFQGNLKGNLGWQTVTNGATTGTSVTNLTLVVEEGSEVRVGAFGDELGTLTLDAAAGTLTWQTTAVPEPSTYAMVLAGLALGGLVVRRRAAK